MAKELRIYQIRSDQSLSRVRLCDPMNHSTPGLPVHHQLPEFTQTERLLLNHANTPGFLAPGGEEFNPGPETRLDRSELLCNEVLLKYRDRESF